MATLFTNSASADGFYFAAHRYYQMCPEHRGALGTLPLPIVRTVVVSPWSLQDLVNTIHEQLRNQDDKDVLIVSHGAFDDHDKIIGLKCPISRHSPQPKKKLIVADEKMLKKLADWLTKYWKFEKADDLEGDEDPKLVARGELIALFHNLHSLQRVGLRRVDFAGCQIGKNLDWLKQFGRCLGCLSISGPDSDYGYHTLTVYYNTRIGATPDAKKVADWVKQHPFARKFQDATSSKAIWIDMVPTQGHQADFPATANTYDFTWFVDQFVMRGSRYPRGQATNPQGIPIFALVRNGSLVEFFLPQERQYAERFFKVDVNLAFAGGAIGGQIGQSRP